MLHSWRHFLRAVPLICKYSRLNGDRSIADIRRFGHWASTFPSAYWMQTARSSHCLNPTVLTEQLVARSSWKRCIMSWPTPVLWKKRKIMHKRHCCPFYIPMEIAQKLSPEKRSLADICIFDVSRINWLPYLLAHCSLVATLGSFLNSAFAFNWQFM